MYPKLIDIGPFPIHTYGLMMVLGFVVAILYLIWQRRRIGLDVEEVLDFSLLMLIFSIVGAKVLYILQDLPIYLRTPKLIITNLGGGLVWYGGLVVAGIAGFIFVHRKGIPAWRMADTASPAIALGHALGRIGCLMGGCCYGKPCDLPWAVTFTDPYTALHVGTPLDIPLHPTQLYSALLEFLLFIMLHLLLRRNPVEGSVFFSYLTTYAVGRFIIEFFRNDLRSMLFGGALSISQFIAIIMFLTGVCGLCYKLQKKPHRKQYDPSP